MTRHHQLRFEISDLLTVILTCEECHTSLSYPMDAFGATSEVLPRLPKQCPQCEAAWALDTDHSPIRRLLFALSQYREFIGRGKPAVRLQFDLPDERGD